MSLSIFGEGGATQFHGDMFLDLGLPMYLFSTEKKKKKPQKNPHSKRVCKLSFIWGKMRTLARETAFQIALRSCSREVGEKVIINVILVKGEYMQLSTYSFFFFFFLLAAISRHHREGL